MGQLIDLECVCFGILKLKCQLKFLKGRTIFICMSSHSSNFNRFSSQTPIHPKVNICCFCINIWPLRDLLLDFNSFLPILTFHVCQREQDRKKLLCSFVPHHSFVSWPPPRPQSPRLRNPKPAFACLEPLYFVALPLFLKASFLLFLPFFWGSFGGGVPGGAWFF